MKMPENGRIYALNEGNLNDFEPGLKAYVRYCQSHEIKPVSLILEDTLDLLLLIFTVT
jgi:fructose-1,6-bisphosphatase